MAITSANITNLLKKIYSGASQAHFMLGMSPLLGLIEKKMIMTGGSGTVIPAIYGDYAGRSADFAESQTSMSEGLISSEAFTITTPNNYVNAKIGHKALMETNNNAHAFINIIKEAHDSNMRILRKDLAFDLFRDGSGIVGTIASVNSQTITFTDRKGLRKLDIGSRLYCYSSSTLGTKRAETAIITHIDRSAGSIVVTGTLSAWTTGDSVTVAGDANAKIKGVAAWIPAVAPVSGDNFFGVDRSKDPVALAGVRFDAGSLMLKDALIDASAELVEISEANPSIIVLSPKKFAELSKETSDRSTVVGFSGKEEIGYTSIKVAGAYGMMDCVIDPNCPDNRAYMIDLSTWAFMCTGSNRLFSTWEEDGLAMLRSNASNDIELRLFSYAQLACFKPSSNAVILFNS